MAAQLREIRLIQIPRTPPRDPGVQRDDNPLESGRFGPFDETFRQRAVVRGVELEKAWSSSELLGDYFKGIDRKRRGNHRNLASRCNPGGSQVSVTILRAKPKHPDGRHEDRRR